MSNHKPGTVTALIFLRLPKSLRPDKAMGSADSVRHHQTMYRIIGADEKEYGPITVDQLRQWIAEGRANAQTRVLPEGATEWTTVGQVPELAALLPSAP